jgi:hypothetical protein
MTNFQIHTHPRYSGVAWAWSDRFTENHGIVMNWDGMKGRTTSAKVPSKLLYDGSEAPKWGFGVPSGAKCLQWFKLLLLEESSMPEDVRSSTYIREARQMLRELGKSAIDVVADYLRLLWRHALKEMVDAEGETEVEGQPFWVVITFPAIWPLYAQNRMHQGATLAGIADRRHAGETRLDLYPEPEAASLTIMDYWRGEPVQVCE